MADTTDLSIDELSWTEVSIGSAGFITNSGSKALQYIEAAIAPAVDDIIGHTMNPNDFVSYVLDGSQKIFAKSNRGTGGVTVTQD